MARNHIQKGDAMTFTNTTGAEILSGQVVPLGSRCFIAMGAIPIGATGELATCEVWVLPKATGAIAQGASVFYDADGNPVGGTEGSGAITTTATDNTAAGYAFAPAAESDPTVRVKLG